MRIGKIAIVDVGHGNCAVIHASNQVVAIDTGSRSAFVDYLEQEGIDRIDTILISHADQDHLGGLLVALSGGFDVGQVHVNPDQTRHTKIWRHVVGELDRREQSKKVDWNTLVPGTLQFGPIHLEVLGPSKSLVALGTDSLGRRVKSNSRSGVIRLLFGGEPVVLLPGDLDEIGLDDLHRSKVNLRAPILVFPHHGGLPGSGNAVAFAHQLCSYVEPQTVIFSIGRGSANPRPEIVAAVREAITDVRVVCTQLSRHCAQESPISVPSHLNLEFASGRKWRSCHCCAGTLVIDLGKDSFQLRPRSESHQAFIRENAPTALCRISSIAQSNRQ